MQRRAAGQVDGGICGNDRACSLDPQVSAREKQVIRHTKRVIGKKFMTKEMTNMPIGVVRRPIRPKTKINPHCGLAIRQDCPLVCNTTSAPSLVGNSGQSQTQTLVLFFQTSNPSYRWLHRTFFNLCLVWLRRISYWDSADPYAFLGPQPW